MGSLAEGKGLIGGRISDRRGRRGVTRVPGPHYINPCDPSDAEALVSFVGNGPVDVEIGFGRGEFLLALASAMPHLRLLGFEIRRKFFLRVAPKLEAAGLANVRLVHGDAREVLCLLLPDGSVGNLFVLFPDPWWKKRYEQRRHFTPDFADLLARKLAPGGRVIVKTDVEAYAAVAAEVFDAHPSFSAAEPEPLPPSHREKKSLERRLRIHVLCYVKMGRG